jgi:hypothetical protein
MLPPHSFMLNGQSLAYFYARENDNDANTAGLPMDEARRSAIHFL